MTTGSDYRKEPEVTIILNRKWLPEMDRKWLEVYRKWPDMNRKWPAFLTGSDDRKWFRNEPEVNRSEPEVTKSDQSFESSCIKENKGGQELPCNN